MPIESARIAIMLVLLLASMFLTDSRHADHDSGGAPYSTGGRQ